MGQNEKMDIKNDITQTEKGRPDLVYIIQPDEFYNWKVFMYKTLMNYIKDNYNYSLIGTLGESMGAATVLKHLGKYNSVDFTIADCPYESLRKQIKSRINKLIKLPGFVLLPIIDAYLHLLGGYGFKDVNIKESVINIKKPFMLVHGSTDSYISVEDSLNLKLANDNCKKIYICNGADHARSYEQDTERYKEEVNDFLNSINLK